MSSTIDIVKSPRSLRDKRSIGDPVPLSQRWPSLLPKFARLKGGETTGPYSTSTPLMLSSGKFGSSCW